jgi:hypothetical protein
MTLNEGIPNVKEGREKYAQHKHTVASACGGTIFPGWGSSLLRQVLEPISDGNV